MNGLKKKSNKEPISKCTAKKTVLKKSAPKKTAKKRVVKKKPSKAKKTVKIIKKEKKEKNSRSKSVALRNKLSLAILSPFRFPITTESFAIQSARVSGLTFVVIGAFFSIYHTHAILDQAVTQAEYTSMTATAGDATFNFSITAEDPDFVTVTQDPISAVHVESIDKTPDGKISTKENPTFFDVYTIVKNAQYVEIKAVHTKTGVLHTLGRAKQISSDTWQYILEKKQYKEGEYAMYAEITNEHGTYKSSRKNISIEEIAKDSTSVEDTEPSEEINSSESETHVFVETKDTVEYHSTTLRDPVLYVHTTEPINGSVGLTVSVSGASKVEIYIKPILSSVPQFIGRAHESNSSEWYLKWNTKDTPNGEYRVYAVIDNDGENSSSAYVKAVVENTIHTTPADEYSISASSETTETNEKEHAIEEEEKTEVYNAVKQKIADIHEEQKEVMPIIQEGTEVPVSAAEPTEFEGADIVEQSVVNILEEYQKEIDSELTRLASSIRSGNEEQVERTKERIQDLKEKIIKDSYSSATDEFIAFIDKRLSEEVEILELRVVQVEEIVKERIGDAITKDTDGDGITDFDERTIYNTDPEVGDSDGDGFTDGAEILNGYNPTDATPEVLVEYESPKERGIVRNDFLAVETIEAVFPEVASSTLQKDGKKTAALITGKALPNSFVRLYIFSTPVIVTVKTDAEGGWSYTFDKELEEGNHEVYVGITDNAGKIVAKSEPFQFIKVAEAFTPIASVDVGVPSITAPVKEKSFISENIILLVLSISVVIIGLILLLLGLHLRARRGEHLAAEGSLQNAVT